MRELEKRCAAMAADMLDAELIAIDRKIAGQDKVTPLQAAVLAEMQRRTMGR